MKPKPMREIRNWAASSGRWIEKEGRLFVLCKGDHRSRALERATFRRACTRMMAIEAQKESKR